MQRLSGKVVAAATEERLAEAVARLTATSRAPCLAVILVGENPESQSYVRSKVATAQRIGMRSFDRVLPASISQAELEQEIQSLNEDATVDGILCQLPLPSQLDEGAITRLIDPAKDVDCFHPYNFGLLAQGSPAFLPATPAGILAILEYYEIATSGRHVVVVGRSNIVGRPLSLLLSHKGHDATVTVCHSKTHDLKAMMLQADILVASLGSPEFVKAEMVREGAVVVDVGINRIEDASRERGWRLVGDVAYAEVAAKAAAITPVPGGVGPMTIIMVLQNTLWAASQQLDSG